MVPSPGNDEGETIRMMRPGASVSAAVRAETRDDLEDEVLKDVLGISRDARAKLLPTNCNVNLVMSVITFSRYKAHSDFRPRQVLKEASIARKSRYNKLSAGNVGSDEFTTELNQWIH